MGDEQREQVRDWLVLAMNCTACPLAGHQTKPITYAGSFLSKYLVIGQNPGEIRKTDVKRLSLAKVMNSEPDPFRYRKLYHHDFETSTAAFRMALIFGPDWINNGDFCFTNVALCRTVGNVMPLQGYVDTCIDQNIGPFVDLWAKQANAKAVVLMGRSAQTLLIPYPNLQIWQIPHYARWNARGQVTELKKQWESFR